MRTCWRRFSSAPPARQHNEAVVGLTIVNGAVNEKLELSTWWQLTPGNRNRLLVLDHDLRGATHVPRRDCSEKRRNEIESVNDFYLYVCSRSTRRRR